MDSNKVCQKFEVREILERKYESKVNLVAIEEEGRDTALDMWGEINVTVSHNKDKPASRDFFKVGENYNVDFKRCDD